MAETKTPTTSGLYFGSTTQHLVNRLSPVRLLSGEFSLTPEEEGFINDYRAGMHWHMYQLNRILRFKRKIARNCLEYLSAQQKLE